MAEKTIILKRAIKKANKASFGVNDGWLIPGPYKLLFDDENKKLIFNHEFCKALWGEEHYMTQTHEMFPLKENEVNLHGVSLEAWQYHLQMMVISPDPIKYLGDHI